MPAASIAQVAGSGIWVAINSGSFKPVLANTPRSVPIEENFSMVLLPTLAA